MNHYDHAFEIPGEHLDLERMPGHWLLARMGKRVLRPGGLELTRRMLEQLGIGPCDQVVEFAPGLGTTTRIVLASAPSSYVGIERDEAAVRATRRVLRRGDEVRQGVASGTGLDDGCATVIFGEAMLTMQTAAQKGPSCTKRIASFVKEDDTGSMSSRSSPTTCPRRRRTRSNGRSRRSSTSGPAPSS